MKNRNVIEDVYIRDSMVMERRLGNEWYKIENAILDSDNVPIYYQELQPRDPKSYKFNDVDIIGTASNTHLTKDGKLVCDVLLNPFNTLTEHFTGIIDNYGLTISTHTVNNKVKQVYKVERFIVYDKNKKKEVTEYARKQRRSSKSGKRK